MDSCKAKKNRKWRDWHLLWLPHWVLFPLWQYLFLFKGNIVHLNCSPMVTEDGMKGSVLTAQLYGGDIDISVNVMPHQHLEYDLWTPTSEIFSFFFYWQHVSLIPGGVVRSLTDLSGKRLSCSDWAKENMPESKQSEYTSPVLCLFFHRPSLRTWIAYSWGIFSPVDPPCSEESLRTADMPD